MKRRAITEDTVVSHSICERKSYHMLFVENDDEEQAYAAYLRERVRNVEHWYFEENTNCLPFSSDKFTGKADVIFGAEIRTGILELRNFHLQKQALESMFGCYSYSPLIFSSSYKVTPEDRIRASYIGSVLGTVQGIVSKNATIVLADRSLKKIRMNSESHLPIITKLREWLNFKPEIPPITFIKHCSICPYEKRCVKTAECDDSISLLGNMTTKVQRKYESKGIFTIHQLSYLYRPRRRCRYWGERKPTHQYELQALALRTKSIYTTNLVEPPNTDIEIFVDIESIPDQRFHYLFGVLIATPDTTQYYPYWANSASDEKSIWDSFLERVNRYPSATIFHYGSYEKNVIAELADRYGNNIADVLARLCNVNQYIYGRIYFPTHSNRLKDICAYLGLTWTAKNASGLNSIVWRAHYDNNQQSEIRDKLILYNEEDCTNLKALKKVVGTICASESALPDVVAADDQNQLLSESGSQVVKDFTALLKSAHGKYENSKISLKKKKSKKPIGQSKKRGYNYRSIPKSKIDKEVRVARGRICPVHKRALRPTSLTAAVVIIDLVCTSKGIKKTTTKYWGYKGRCPNCSSKLSPPGMRRFGRNAKYGDGLKAWIAYQRLTMRLPYRKITQLLEDSFHIVIASSGVNTLFQSVCSGYRKAEKCILKEIIKSPKIHVDETLVNIQGKIQYVWVFTDGDHVIFRLTPTRDSSIVHKILNEFEGVLVSDFYAGYDAVKCVQQKCWAHLIRDINDDLRKNPFDSEFEGFVLALRSVLMPIFDAIDKYGLKKRNLNKFGKHVDAFYKKNVDKVDHQSEITKKYQKRFTRYRQSLFTFMKYDDIPWNNNMAERALRHLAVQRKISGSFFASGMTEYLILLGIMQTCRFQNKPFLEFLMSSETSIDNFKGKNKKVKGWLMT
jgi:predicted RecB family nuclease